ncbi:MAG: hypothetical protein ACF8OB_17930 [Phycisphaeraceae bacterium JB051]
MISSLCFLSWLLMMLIHETGHVLAAILTGGHVHQVAWHPTVFSHTDVHPNPSPLLVVWGGPVVGVGIALLTLLLHRWIDKATAYLSEFFAGFCLLANGLYIGIGWVDQIGDTAVMQKHGTPIFVMIVFGLLCVPTGLLLWHGISCKVGLARTSQCTLNPKHVWLTLGLAILLGVIGLLVGNPG